MPPKPELSICYRGFHSSFMHPTSPHVHVEVGHTPYSPVTMQGSPGSGGNEKRGLERKGPVLQVTPQIKGLP